jgi:hypothetical protein
VLAVTRLTNSTNNGVTLSQVVLLHLTQRNINVRGPGKVTLGAHKSVVIEDVENSTNGNQHVIIGNFWLAIFANASATTTAIATATAGVVVVSIASSACFAVVVTGVAVLGSLGPARFWCFRFCWGTGPATLRALVLFDRLLLAPGIADLSGCGDLGACRAHPARGTLAGGGGFV